MFQLPPAPNPADVRKFLLSQKVPPATARAFCAAPHIDWAEDVSEVLYYQHDTLAHPNYVDPTLARFFKALAPEFARAGVTVRKLPKPKKGVPPGHEAHFAEFAYKRVAPVRHLFTRDPDGEASFAPARDLDAVLRAFDLGLYLDLRWLDGDGTVTRILSAREWDRAAKLLGEGVRDRLFVRADRVPADYTAALQFQYELWTGETGPRDEWEQICERREYTAMRLSPAFLERHRAALDSFGAWEEVQESTVLSVAWAHPVGVDRSWVPIELRASVEDAGSEEHVGCGVGRFDPPERTFELLRAFVADSKAVLERAKSEVAEWKRGKPRRARYELYWIDGDPMASLGFWFRDTDDEDDPEKLDLDPDTGAPLV